MRPKLHLFLFIAIIISVIGCREDFDHRLEREARQYTANNCPNEPEKGTRLDSTSYTISTRTYTLWYSLSEMNEQVFVQQRPLLHHLLVSRLKADPAYKRLKEEKVNFSFIYRSLKRGNVVYATLVKPEEYRLAD